jgi:hypothetical protein
MTHVMCNFWKRTFTLAPLVPLIVFSPNKYFKNVTTRWISIFSQWNGYMQNFNSSFSNKVQTMRLHWGTWMPYVTLISFMGSLAWLCLYVDRNIIRQKCFYVWFFEFYEVDPIGVYKFYCDSYVKFEDPSFENMHKFVTITINSKPWCKSKLLKYTRKRWQWVQVNS